MTWFIILIETLFFTIPLIIVKEIRDKKVIALLYVCILLSSVISGLILDKSIFKYFLLTLLIFISLKYICKCKNSSHYDIYIIIMEMLLKTAVEYCCAMTFFNLVSYNIFVILMEIISIIVIFLLSKYIYKFYNITIKKWKGRHKFYFRYILLLLLNTSIIFIIYNLILIQGGA